MENTELRTLMVDAFKSKDYIGCLYNANQLLASDPDNAVAKSYYARALYEVFNYNTIINYLKDAINSFVDIDDYLYLALAYYSIGDYKSAVNYFNELLKINPVHYHANIYTGLCYKTAELFDFDKAEQYFLNAIKSDKSKTDAYAELIDLYSNNYATSEKQNELLNLLEQNADSEKLLELLTRYTYQIGNYDKTIQYATKLIQYNNIPDYYVLRAYAYLYTNDLNKSKDDAKTILQLDSGNQNAISLLLSIANADISIFTADEIELTSQIADNVIKNNPNSYEGNLALLFTIDRHFHNNQYDKALEYIDIFEKRDHLPQLPLNILYEKIDCLINFKRIDEAIDILNNLAKEIDDDYDSLLKIDIKQKLMMIYAQQGRVDAVADIANEIKQLQDRSQNQGQQETEVS